MGERVLRGVAFNGKLERWFLNGEIFLLAEGSTDPNREVARRIQHGAAAFGVGLQAAGAGGLHPNA